MVLFPLPHTAAGSSRSALVTYKVTYAENPGSLSMQGGVGPWFSGGVIHRLGIQYIWASMTPG